VLWSFIKGLAAASVGAAPDQRQFYAALARGVAAPLWADRGINDAYLVKAAPVMAGWRTFEIGGGLGEHLKHEDLSK
jgi:hypothetical protein